jgi:hypothetical protein
MGEFGANTSCKRTEIEGSDMTEMTKPEIRKQRLMSQGLARPAFKRAAEAVGWLGAVQAQDYAAAKWGLGLRIEGAANRDIDQAFARGAILRTHLLRPTWHFVTPSDIRWMLMLTAPRVHAANAHMYRKLELDDAVFKRSNAALTKALRGGEELTRHQLRGVLRAAGVALDGESGPTNRMSYLMMCAELEGIVCSGPRRGSQFTYALLDERAPRGKTLRRDEALAELARRYFLSRGPARVHDFAKWSGLTVADAQFGLEAVQGQLRSDVFGDQAYWSSARESSTKVGSPTAHLLSVYDEYVSGYKGWDIIVDERLDQALKTRGNAPNYIILVDGRIVGTWKRAIKTDAVAVDLNLLTSVTEAQQRAVFAAAAAYGDFLGLPAVAA